MIPFIDLKRLHEPIKNELMLAIKRVVDSGNFILGPEVASFEKEIARYLGVKHAIGVASGSDALLLSLMALGIKEGDEVITTPFTFFATAGAIMRLGATPVFVDVDERTFNINPSLIESAITSKTKAILPVHIFGQPSNMSEIMMIAKKHDLFVVEDACQAIGAEWKGRKVGSIGDLGCFSFFPTKNLGGFGDGGLVVTNNDEFADYLRKARVHGAKKKYEHQFIGINSRLDALQAAVLRVKLKYLNYWNAERIKIAQEFNDLLRERFITPFVLKGAKHVYHQYALLVKEGRDEVLVSLRKKGVMAGVYYPKPLHLQESFLSLGYKKGDLPVAEEISKKILSIPLYPEVKKYFLEVNLD